MANVINNEKKRFAIISFRRNIDDELMSSAPLAILSMRYNEDEHQHWWSGLPNSRPDMKQSGYMYFHKQCKTNFGYVALHHQAAASATDGMGNETSTRPIQSFDIRRWLYLMKTFQRSLIGSARTEFDQNSRWRKVNASVQSRVKTEEARRNNQLRCNYSLSCHLI